MSANDAISPPITPLSEHSTFPSTAPQLAAPKLQTPVEEVSWSLISSTIDQMFNDPSYQHNRDSAVGQRLSQLGIRGELTKDVNKRYSTSVLDDRHLLVRAGGVQDNTSSNDVTNSKSTRVTSSPLLGRSALQQTQLGENTTSTRSSAIGTTNVDAIIPDPSQSSQSDTKEKAASLSRTRSSTRRRRPSSISDISEVSHSPGGDELVNVLTRTVSPPPEELTNNRSQEVPFFLSHDESKEAEARREREDAMVSAGHGSLPPYSGPTDRTSQARIAPGTQIVPVTDLRGVRAGDRRASGRPFSFMGTETLSSVPSYRPGSSPPPITPIDASQRQSQVGAKRREPDIMDHPAYRTAQEEMASRNPLPSSQRPAGHLDLVKQHTDQRAANDTPAEQYRIPGPYVQEYRPPKPKQINEDFYHSHARSMKDIDTVSTAGTANEIKPDANTPMKIKPLPQVAPDPSFVEPRPSESDRTRNKSFGGLFRSRSGSRTREERDEQARNTDNLSEENRKQRKVLFRFNSSNSALGPQLGDLPEEGIHQAQIANQGGHRRTLSSDLLRTNPFGSKNQTDTKKKRSSALASLFSRSGNKDRSRSTTPLSQRSDVSGPMQQPSMQSLRARAASPGSIQGIASERTSPNPQSVLRQDVYGSQNSAPSTTENREHPRRTTSMDETGNNFYRNERPDRLRINTGNDARIANESFTASTATPYTATPAGPYHSSSTQATSYSNSPPVPITRANRDISYGQDRPYVPPVLPPVQAKPQPNIAEHVKDLHKRSRSPRLGRPPSEDGLRRADGNAVQTLDVLNPVNGLGTFSNKKASPVGTQRSEEDQEKPWTLTLPSGASTDEDEDEAYVMVNHEQSFAGNGNRHEGSLRRQKTLESVPEGVSPVESHQTMRAQENDLTRPRQSREMKRVLLERTPSPFLAGSESGESKSTKPQTVAERFMGVQAPARSTTPQTSPPIHQHRFFGDGETHAPTVSRDNTTTTARSTQSSINNNTGRTSTVLTPIHNDTSSIRGDAGSRAFSRQSDHRSPTPSSQRPISPIQVSSTQGHQSSAYRAHANAKDSGQPSKNFAPVELPGSKPEGYESEDEPVMSATAYPGQEWMPVYADDGKWED